MKTTYTLSITNKNAKASYLLTYDKGYFKRIEKLSGKVTDAQHKWLMNLAPQLEKAILILETEWNPKGVFWEKQQKNGSNTLFKTMIDCYYSWYKERFNIVPKINGLETKALKDIITHLSRMATTEMEIIETWNAVLSNWDYLTNFHQQQMELRQINQNLNIILRTIKENGGQTKYSR